MKTILGMVALLGLVASPALAAGPAPPPATGSVKLTDEQLDRVVGGIAVNAPGVVSGNILQVPVHIPVNVCGNTINVVGLLNPAFGNTCVSN